MGFGGATAHAFVREGATVVLTDIADETGTRAAEALRADGAEVRFRRLDVTSETNWKDVIESTVSDFGRLDVLVNNAGTANDTGLLEHLSEAIWDGEMAVHAKGVFLGTKQVIPVMRAGGGGSIVNISSIMGLVGSPTSPAYTAAKGAIRLFTKTAAIQYAVDNIRVNSVHPGYAMTPMTVEDFSKPAVRDELLAKTPLGRFGTAQDIANGVLFLASDESSFMTGSELVIDGGMTAQ